MAVSSQHTPAQASITSFIAWKGFENNSSTHACVCVRAPTVLLSPNCPPSPLLHRFVYFISYVIYSLLVLRSDLATFALDPYPLYNNNNKKSPLTKYFTPMLSHIYPMQTKECTKFSIKLLWFKQHFTVAFCGLF